MNTESDEGDKPSRGWYAVIIAAAIVSSAVIAFFVRGGMSDLQRLREQKKYLRQQNKRLKKKARELEIRRRRLHQDPQLIEEIARDRLGLARPGEKQVELSEPTPDTGARQDTADTDTVGIESDSPANSLEDLDSSTTANSTD